MIFTISLNYYFVTDSSRSSFGLVITQSLCLIRHVQLVVRLLCNVENEMSSVEAVLEYSNIVQETSQESPKGEITHIHKLI